MFFAPSSAAKKLLYQSTFSQHLREAKVLKPVLEKNAAPELLQDQKTEKLFRKYFGKRITSLCCNSRSHKLCSSAHRYKGAKTLKLSSSYMKRYNLMSLRNLQISYLFPASSDFKALCRGISVYKRLESLQLKGELRRYAFEWDFEFHPMFAQLRKLPHLQHLSLIIFEDRLIDNTRTILQLNHLKRLDLTILDDDTRCKPYSKHDIVSQFYLELLNFKGLAFLGLDIKASESSCHISNRLFLERLSKTSIPAFYIKIKSTPDLEPDALQAALERIDILHFEFSRLNFFDFSYTTAHSTSQLNRRLDIMLGNVTHKIGEPYNFATIPQDLPFDLAESPKLFFQGLIGHCVPISGLTSSLRSLRSITCRFSLCEPAELPRAISCLKHILMNAESLQQLSLHEMKFLSSVNENYKDLFKQIANMKSLETLVFDDFTMTDSVVDVITDEVISKLTDLKKLSLNIKITRSKSFSVADFKITFPESSMLSDLKLRLPIVSSQMRENVINGVAKLDKLEKLEIEGGAQLFEEEKHRNLLLAGLNNMTRLERVHIIPGEKVLSFGSKGNATSRKDGLDVQEYVKEMFRKNICLAHFYLETDNYTIIYDRYE